MTNHANVHKKSDTFLKEIGNIKFMSRTISRNSHRRTYILQRHKEDRSTIFYNQIFYNLLYYALYSNIVTPLDQLIARGDSRMNEENIKISQLPSISSEALFFCDCRDLQRNNTINFCSANCVTRRGSQNLLSTVRRTSFKRRFKRQN